VTTLADLLAPVRICARPGADPGALRAYQADRLRRIVEHARTRVPLYRRLYREAGIGPGDIRTLEDLARLPSLSKADLRREPIESLLADGSDPARLLRSRTTGSTGVPFTAYASPHEELLQHIVQLRALRSYGLGRRDRMVKILHRRRVPWPWRVAQALGAYRQVQLDLTEAPRDLAQALVRERPDILIGNAGVIARVAECVRDEGILGIRPRYVLTSAELLTAPMRRVIEETFRAPVHDQYATMELGLLAWQCRSSRRYHVCADRVILEVLRDGAPVRAGERGEVVVTALHGRHMPFLRYRLEDEVEAGEPSCPCGQPFPTITAIRGRMTDYLALPGGRSLFASAVAYVLHEHAQWIQRYELVQERLDHVGLRAVVRPRPASAELTALGERIQALLGPGVTLTIELVPFIEPGPGGKFRVLRSHLASPYRGTGA
jgi:phenylacetate-CoA ligase